VRHDSASYLANILLLSKPYKNESAILKEEIDKVLSWDSNGLWEGRELCSFGIYGAGGSPTNAVTQVYNQKKFNKDSPHLETAVYQDKTQKVNSTLIEICARQGVVAVFVDLNNFGKSKDVREPESLRGMFLGYYSCSKTEYTAIPTAHWEENEEARNVHESAMF
jgi:hypothetical protein